MKGLILFLSLLSMTMLYSCGGSNGSGSSLSSSTSALGTSGSTVTVNGVTSTPAGAFTGTWSGYVDDTYTGIVIQANGNITISGVGQATVQRLLITQNAKYYIVDPQTKYITAQVKVSGSILTINYIGGGSDQLNKN